MARMPVRKAPKNRRILTQLFFCLKKPDIFLDENDK